MEHSTVARWWFALALEFALLLAPGPQRSFFSGMPLSSRATALFLGVVILAVASILWPPTRPLRLRWLAALALLVAVKLALATTLIDSGWRAEYWTPSDWRESAAVLRKAQFVTRRGIESSRIDAAPELAGETANLSFLNDYPRPTMDWLKLKRDVALPLLVRWRGWPRSANDTVITATGRVRCFMAGRLVLDTVNPSAVPLHIAGANEVLIEYYKPPRVEPAITVAGITARVMPQQASAVEIVRSDHAASLIGLLSLAALAIVAVALFDAYPRMSELLLERVWQTPMKVGALVFFAAFIAAGLRVSIPIRRVTQLMPFGDDPIAYEGQARLIVRHGLLMTEHGVTAHPYYFYPFYSYALATMHRLFGDDMANVVLFNYICIASLGILVYGLLRRHVSAGAGIFTLAAVAFFEQRYMLDYAATAFTDNLFIPLSLMLVLCCSAALERRSGWLLFMTGVLTAVAAATRPSALLFVPCFGLWLLVERDGGPFWRRIRSATQFTLGFAAGISPFTLRNWIVSRKFVLLIASFVMLSFFLYPPETPVPNLTVDGGPPTFVESLHQFADCWRQFPGRTLWTEVRKFLFTMGLTKFGPPGFGTSFVFPLFPIFFALAVWSGRMPRHLRNAMLVFGASHVVALIVAAPWTYGYKTIVPLSLVFIIGSTFLLPNWGEVEIAPTEKTIRNPATRRKISVILPTYNEKDSIRAVIDAFFATGFVDEVLVINNNAVEGTSEAVAGSGAVEIFERQQGYGAAIRRGLAEATHELIVVCEPDGTFLPRDIEKLLAYSEDFDVVYGSRTSQQLVWRGANMGMFLRWGNWFVAKYIEFLYNATSLTDVGCTMRLVRRDVARELCGRFRINGSQFGPEMMIETLRAGCRVIQIPVNYMPRVGVSAVTGDPAKAFRLGLEMIWLITRRRFEDLSAKPEPVLPVNRPQIS